MCYTGGECVGVWPGQGQEESASEAAPLRPHGGRHVCGRVPRLQHHREWVPRPHLSHVGPQPARVCETAARSRRAGRSDMHQRTHGKSCWTKRVVECVTVYPCCLTCHLFYVSFTPLTMI